MADSEKLRILVARPYLDRARHAALAGRFREAEQHLEHVRRIDPKSYEASLLTAKIRLHEGRLAECREAILEARRLGHPEDESNQMVSWLDAHARNRASASMDQPKTGSTTRVLGRDEAPQLARLGTTSDLLFTIQKLRTHLAMRPHCATGLARMAEALAQKSLYWGGSGTMLDEAETYAGHAIAISPSTSEAHAALGFIYRLRGANLDAERKLRQALELDECNWFALHGLGLLLTRRGAYELGARLLTNSIERQPLFIPNYDAIFQAFLGLTAHDHAAQALQEGIDQANARLATTSNDLVARTQLAILLAKKGMRTESRAATRDTTNRFPKSGFAWAHCAITHAVNGDIEDAIQSLATARGRKYDIRLIMSRSEFDPARSADGFAKIGQSSQDG
jgi:tetratricopeptide (TPR) repeat protein